MFFWNSFFFNDPADVGNLISGSSVFSKTSLNIWKFTVHVLLKPGLENFEHYFTSVWDECNCAVVWVFFWIAFLWDWNENWSWQPLCKWPGFPFFVQRKMWWGYFCLFMSLVSVKYSNLNQQPAYPLEKWLILAAMSLACPFPKNPLKLHHE